MKFLIAIILGGIMTGLLITIDKWFPFADSFLKKHSWIEKTLKYLFYMSLFCLLTVYFYTFLISLK